MKTITTAAMLISACLLGGGAQAQTSQSATAAPMETSLAGTIQVRIRAIGVIPEDASSSVSVIGGKVNVSATPAPEVDVSYFFTDNISAELIAASTRHEVSAAQTVLGKVDVGSAYVLPPTVTAQYHFLPHSAFSPYIGAGLTVAFFYDTNPAGPTVTKFGLSNAIGPAIEAGVDYNLTGKWFLNFDIKQIFLKTQARINGGAIVANTWLDPLVIGAGIGYRF